MPVSDQGRSTRPRLAAAAIVLALAAGALPSFADGKTENEAKKLQGEAMDFDFMALDLKKAKSKLADAIKKCGKDKCGKTIVATLHRDLGIVAINANDAAAGEKEFAAAFAADTGVVIAKEFLDNAEVRKAWEAAKKKAGGGTTPSTATATATGTTEPPTTAEGGLTVKLSVAPVGYELPVVIEVPKGVDVSSVKVSFKTDLMEKYKAIEAKKLGNKWLAIIDCANTGSATNIKFFVKAFDGDNAELDHYGTIKKPAVVKVLEKVEDADLPLLPGDKEPKSCTGGEEGGNKKPEGAGCESDDECEKGLVCIVNDSGKKWCKPGEKKAGSSDGAPKIWIGLDGSADILLVSEETNICKLKYWACVVSSNTKSNPIEVGSDAPNAIVLGPTGGKTTGGPAVGPLHLALSLDYFVAKQLSIGMRLGYAFGGNPSDSAKFVPVHAEARMQYFFLDGGIRPFLLVAGGYAMMDAPVPNIIVEPNDITQVPPDLQGKQAPAGVDCSVSPEKCKDVVRGVKGYKLVGPGFAALGLGVWFMVGNKAALNLAFKVDFPLPVFSLGFTPELGFKIGF
jgi:hypothetical protein